MGQSVSSGARAVTNTLGITTSTTQVTKKVAFLGLDGSGKTTLCHRMGPQKEKSTLVSAMMLPQISEAYGFSFEGVDFQILEIDLGGSIRHRHLYRYLFANVDAVFFFVDSCDKDRFPQAKEELDRLLSEEDTPEFKNVPFVILGNKIDIPTAVSEGELKRALGFEDVVGSNLSAKKNQEQEQAKIKHEQPRHSLTGKYHAPREKNQRPCELFMTCIVDKHSVAHKEAFHWLFAIWKIRKNFPEPRPGCWEHRKRVLLCAFRGKSRLSRVMHEEYVVLRLTTKK